MTRSRATDDETRRAAVARVLAGERAADVARDLADKGVVAKMLSAWVGAERKRLRKPPAGTGDPPAPAGVLPAGDRPPWPKEGSWELEGQAKQPRTQLLPTPTTMDSLPPRTPEQVADMRGRGFGVRNLRETVVNELPGVVDQTEPEVVDAEIMEDEEEWDRTHPMLDEPQEWEEMRAITRRTADNDIELGRRLIRMKARVYNERSGDWQATVKRELGYSTEKAAGLMRVARSAGIRELLAVAPHRLPDSMAARLVLSALSRAEMTVALKDATLDSELKTPQAKVIKAAVRPSSEDEAADAYKEDKEEEEKPETYPPARFCGAQVFEESGMPQVLSGYAGGTATIPLGFFTHALESLAPQAVDVSKKRALACDLFAQSLFQVSESSRHITLWTALEVLSNRRKRPGRAAELVEEFRQAITRARDKSTDTAERDQLQVLLDGASQLRKESIGAAAKRCAESVPTVEASGLDSASLAVESYRARNELVHDGVTDRDLIGLRPLEGLVRYLCRNTPDPREELQRPSRSVMGPVIRAYLAAAIAVLVLAGSVGPGSSPAVPPS